MASWSIDHRKAANVLPDPVGATTRVCAPAEIESQAAAWALVGAAKAPVNQARVADPNRSRGLTRLILAQTYDTAGLRASRAPDSVKGHTLLMTRSLTPAAVGPIGRRGWRAGLFLGLVLLLSSCLKYDLMLMVNDDDTMDGTLIVAVAREFAVGEDVFGQSGDPTPSEGSVSKEPYEDADYIGSRYVITGVPISEIDALSIDRSTRFSLTREGDEYLFDASLDFNLPGSEAVPTEASFTALVSVTFPGAVLESNGTIEGNSAVWTQLRPDADNSLTARASALSNGQAVSASEPGIPWWVWVLGGVGVLLLVGLVVAYIQRKRRAANAAAAAAATGAAGGWPEQQEGGFNEYGSWVPATAYGHERGYYDSGQEGGYGSYYGTYGDTQGQSYGDPNSGAYGGPPGAEPYPQTGYPEGGYSGQTVVSHPDTSQPPSEWTVRRPT